MKSEDIESLTSIRARLIKEFSRCKDYKYDKNALMKEYDHAKVLNGFTDTLAKYFSEKATRSAVGVQSLPLNVCVEVQCVFSYE